MKKMISTLAAGLAVGIPCSVSATTAAPPTPTAATATPTETATAMPIATAMPTATTNPGSVTSYSKAPSPTKAKATAAAASADAGGWTGSFDITSNYMYRGISDSNNTPAFQGGLTYTYPSLGLYFNVWGSNVNFADPQGTTATVEVDTSAGFANSIGKNFSYDIHLQRYNYPKSAASYSELSASGQWKFLTALIAYSSNVFNTHSNGTYYNLGFKTTIPAKYIYEFQEIKLTGGVGHYSLSPNGGLSSYNDLNIGVSKAVGIYVLGLQWTNTWGSNFRRSYDPTHATRTGHLIATVSTTF